MRRPWRASLGAGAIVAFARTSVAAPEPASVSYDPEIGTRIRTADGRWELNPYAMVQLTHVTSGRGSVVETTGFNLHSAKLILHGHIYDPSLTYHFQINGGEGRFVAEDIYLRWQATPWLALLAGQNEVTFNRQHITLEAYQELVERSLVDARFNLQRDIGLIAYLSDRHGRYEATAGLFNGARQNAANDDTGYLPTLRLAWNPWGPIAFREADLDDSARPRLSLAVAGAYNPERNVAAQAPATSAMTLHHVAQGVAETTLRYRGLSLTTEAHARRQAIDAAPPAWDYGALLQAGYFVVPHYLQLVGRLARATGSIGKTEQSGEQTAGISYYFLGHRLKLQTDASRLETRASKEGWRARAQLELFM